MEGPHTNNILKQIVEWASRDVTVRALLLVGSRGRNESVDEFSDYDVAVFARTPTPYTMDNQWLSRIGKVWVCIPEKFERGREIVPTRLVIFEGGIKVDFAFYRLVDLEHFDEGDELSGGFQVLLDKDGKTGSLSPPNAKELSCRKPTEAEFVALVNEFWFETYYVAKYFKRGELWLAKTIDCNLKGFLLKLIEWNEQASHDWKYETSYSGKGMKTWASPETWRSLHQTFAHFDEPDSWKALFATMELFRELSKELAQMLEFTYPEDVDRNMSTFITQIKDISDGQI